MQIQGSSYIHAPQSVNTPHAARPNQGTSATEANSTSFTDQLDISEAGRLADRMSEIPAIRQDKVNALRAAIADGTYDTDDRLSVAVDRLLDEIG